MNNQSKPNWHTTTLLSLLTLSSISGHLFAWGDDPPAWINDKPKITFKSLSPVAVKLISAPQGNDYSDFGPIFQPLTAYLRSEGFNYKIVPEGIKQGAMPYTDRTYTIQELPALANGLTLLQTKMGHKGIGDRAFSIVVATEKPAYLFLAIDERMIRQWQKDGTPEWVQDFGPTGYRIVTDDPTMREERVYQIAARKVAASQIKLGPPWNHPQEDTSYSMYFAFVGSGEPVASGAGSAQKPEPIKGVPLRDPATKSKPSTSFRR